MIASDAIMVTRARNTIALSGSKCLDESRLNLCHIKAIVTSFKHDGLRHHIKLGDEGDTIGNTEIRRHIYRFGSIVLLGILLICATLLKIFNVKTVIYKNGKPILQEAFGNFPDVFFVTTVIISVFVVLRLMFRAK